MGPWPIFMAHSYSGPEISLQTHIFFTFFRKVKAARDAYIKRLNGIYESNLEKVNVKSSNYTFIMSFIAEADNKYLHRFK